MGFEPTTLIFSEPRFILTHVAKMEVAKVCVVSTAAALRCEALPGSEPILKF